MNAVVRVSARFVKSAYLIRGFTMVELAMVLVAAGLLLIMAIRGFTLLEGSKADQLVLQVRQLETLTREYARTRQRLPGDCDGNGLIDAPLSDMGGASLLETGRSSRAEFFTFSAPASQAHVYVTSGNVLTEPGKACPLQASNVFIGTTAGISSTADFNVPFNDLKLQGLLSNAQPNRLAATHAGGDFLALVKVALGATPDTDSTFNAIVILNVPISFARKLAVALDGFDGVSAYKGRVRRLNTAGNGFASQWTTVGESGDSKINVVYFFDQLPLLQMY